MGKETKESKIGTNEEELGKKREVACVAAKAEEQKTIEEAELLRGGAHYEIDENGNKTLVLSEKQIEKQRREEENKKKVLAEAREFLEKPPKEDWLREELATELGDRLSYYGHKEEAIKLYSIALDALGGMENWTPSSSEGRQSIFDDSHLNPKRNLVPLLEKLGRNDEANIVRKEMADNWFQSAEEQFQESDAYRKMLNNNLGYYRELISSNIREKISTYSGAAYSCLNAALKLYKEAGDEEGIKKVEELEKTRKNK